MASWMVHFRLAEQLMERVDRLVMRPFSLGNIAPDSGIPDAEWKTFDPPKEVTHFQRDGLVHDMEFYHGYLRDLNPATERDQFSFRLGYFFHLITDNLWQQRIWQATKKRWQSELEAEPDFVWEIKRDWYGLDFVYMRDHPAMPVWVDFLQLTEVQAELDFLPAKAIMQNVTHIQSFYQRAFDASDERAQASMLRPFIYLAPAEMDRFVSDSAKVLEAVYYRLWGDNIGVGQAKTALELVSAFPVSG